MDAIECLKTRRSVRSYESKPIPKEVLEDIIDCARLAPSANNKQSWEFVAVTGKEALARIAKAAVYGQFTKDAAACIVVCGDKANKHLLEDGSAATENTLLAAWAHGIGTCWIAGWQRTYNNEVKSVLGIPENMDIIAIIAMGYPKAAAKPYGKRKLSEVLHWEKF